MIFLFIEIIISVVLESALFIGIRLIFYGGPGSICTNKTFKKAKTVGVKKKKEKLGKKVRLNG